MSFDFTESESQAFKSLQKDERKFKNAMDLIIEYEGDVDGLRAALEDGIDADSDVDNPTKGVYGFDITLILLLIKLAPVIWALMQHIPDIVAWFRNLRDARQKRRQRRAARREQ